MAPTPARRAADGGVLCWIALRLSEAWDFIDKRDIEKHTLAWLTAICGLELTWDMVDFAREAMALKVSLAEVAALVAAVGVPYGIFAGAVTKWYFERKDP